MNYSNKITFIFHMSFNFYIYIFLSWPDLFLLLKKM